MAFSTQSIGVSTIFHKPWFGSTPVNAKKSTGTLTISGVVSDTQTVTIGDNVYEFDINSTYTAGNIQVDISELRNQATGTLTFAGIPIATETVTVGTDVFEFVATDGDETDGHIPVILGSTFTADNAVTELADAVNAQTTATAVASTAADTVVLTSVVYGTAGNSIATTETCTNASFAQVTLTGGLDTITASNAVTALVAAIVANDEYITAADGAGDTVVATSKFVGDTYNIATTETMANGAWGADTLTGGQFATPCNASSAIIVVGGTIYMTDKPVNKYTEDGWYSVATTLL